MSRPRPWRAVAYWQAGNARVRASRTAARTRRRLDPFIDRWAGMGAVVEVWQVRPIPQVEALVTATATTPPRE